MPSRRAFGTLLLASALARPALAQPGFPDRPIRLLVPLAAGTLTDLVARLLAEPMARDLGSPVLAEPRPGANGALAATLLKQQPADGHTLLLAGVSMLAFNPALYPDLPYDPDKDFSYIAPIGNSPYVLVASRRSGLTTAADFLARARANPDALTFASGGIGHATHLAMDMLAETAGLRLTHVPFSTSSPMPSLISGEVDTLVGPIGTMLPQIEAGRITAIAVFAPRRAAALPDVPSLAEAGLTVPPFPGWYALIGPAGLPDDRAQKLNASLRKALEQPETQARFRQLHLEPMQGSPAELKALQRQEAESWGAFIRQRGMRLN